MGRWGDGVNTLLSSKSHLLPMISLLAASVCGGIPAIHVRMSSSGRIGEDGATEVIL